MPPTPYQSFVEKWCRPYYQTKSVSMANIVNAERHLRAWLPQDYVEAVTRFGVTNVTEEFGKLLRQFGKGPPYISEIMHPADICNEVSFLTNSHGETEFVPLARGPHGDYLGVSQMDLAQTERPEQATVYFANFVTNDSNFAAPSFEGWFALIAAEIEVRERFLAARRDIPQQLHVERDDDGSDDAGDDGEPSRRHQ